MRIRKALIVHVNLDPVPGEFHTAKSAVIGLQGILEDYLNAYNPTIEPAPASIETPTERRKAFLVLIDLDSTAVLMYSQESARHVIQRILRNAIDHCNPVVSLAPANLQPKPEEGTN